MNTTSNMNNGNVASGASTARSNNESKRENGGSSSVASAVGTVTGAGAGAVAGVVIGTALTPETASADDNVQATLADEPGIFDHKDNDTVRPVHTTHTTHISNTEQNINIYNEVPVDPVDPIDEIEVVSYQRVTDPETGKPMDFAVVVEDGAEVAYIDANIDGMADWRVQDVNNDGNIDFGSEVEDVSAQNISMDPFREAYESQPDFNSNNDMADYVNNADVDNFMA